MRDLRLIVCGAVAVLLACGGGSSDGGDACSGDLTRCGGACVDTRTDEAHCGGCTGHACPTGATCEAGECRCPEGQTPCGGACVDLQSSDENCGACGHACGLGTCQAGGCVCQALPVESCGATASPECANLDDDAANCGECGHACAAALPGSQCGGGECQCLAPRDASCSGRCVDLQTDEAHCGTCGHSCEVELPGSQCGSGTCACLAPRATRCGSRCTNLAADAANCGQCGHACPTGATCSGGDCHCPAATPDLCESGNKCVNQDTDRNNCGECGHVCPTGATCASGDCSCGDGKVACGAAAGQCCAGTACCSGGACQAAHANGLGQTYYDCGALDQHTAAQAELAARAYATAGQVEQSQNCGGCWCGTNSAGSPIHTAIWCPAGSTSAGLVQVFEAVSCLQVGCPTPGSPTTFTWH